MTKALVGQLIGLLDDSGYRFISPTGARSAGRDRRRQRR
jgi:hypothetical protein